MTPVSRSLFIFVVSIAGVPPEISALEELSFDYNADFSPVPEYYSEARFFGNVSADGIFNNSLLTLAGIFVVGIILFELALYALDVYYNQTYTSSAYNRKDTFNNENSELPLFYQDYPPYYDPYQSTLKRSLSQSGSALLKNISKIPQWLSLAYETYEASTDLLTDLDCQKKAICEVYQNGLELGEISTRARHSLDYLDALSVFSLPDEFMNIVDEFTDAQTVGKSGEFTCHDLYYCPKSLVELRKMYNQI